MRPPPRQYICIPALIDTLVHDYRARFDTCLDHLRRRDRDRLVDYVIRERRAMVEFLNTGNAAAIAHDNKPL